MGKEGEGIGWEKEGREAKGNGMKEKRKEGRGKEREEGKGGNEKSRGRRVRGEKDGKENENEGNRKGRDRKKIGKGKEKEKGSGVKPRKTAETRDFVTKWRDTVERGCNTNIPLSNDTKVPEIHLSVNDELAFTDFVQELIRR